MPTETLVQRGVPDSGDRVRWLLDRTVSGRGFEVMGVAVAYASVPGVRALQQIANSTTAVTASYWLFGLDDCLTHPSAISFAASLPGAVVRLAGERVNGVRFHPKVYWFSSNRHGGRQALVLGSANLTLRGLDSSVESVVALTTGRGQPLPAIDDAWRRVWECGTPLDPALLNSYQADFMVAQRSRPTPKRPVRDVLAVDTATIDPATASVCWIEVGKITGFRSEQLEIKAEQALFFGLALGGGPDADLDVGLLSGARVQIPAKYRGNAMWRLNLPMDIPEVSRGLRPGGGRSPFAAVFSRVGGSLELRFIRLSSREFKRTRELSRRAGTLGRTAAREYGWY